MSAESATFDPEPSSVPTARGFARRVVELQSDDMDLLMLLVSELASNAVLHARSPFTVRVQHDDHRVRVEVFDDSPALPLLRSPDPSSPTGRGIRLVNDLADEWGSRPLAGGKVVWFEFRSASNIEAGKAAR